MFINKRVIGFTILVSVVSCTQNSMNANQLNPKTLGTNHLGNEKSPYLKQHADNPVWWYSWGDEALNAAKRQNKLIFLSIGYSTCHWCHVMERESYQDKTVADALNESFISIKVDREERPDVDAIYMDAVQAMTGSGGWPLNVILTPDRKPFFGGTYFPKDRLLYVLAQVSSAWKNDPSKITEVAHKLGEYLKTQDRESVSGVFTNQSLSKFFSSFQAGFDSARGGRKGQPKFVPSYDLRVLLRIYERSGKDSALQMVRTTLDHVARGGIYDHLGGGFHRYSTDDHWLVPHFEKMLYDQAALVNTYLEAFQVTHDPEYEAVVRETLDYVLRDMTSPKGGFYSAEDADSEGVEGKFYVWTQSELKKTLTSNEFSEFSKAYGITAHGNFEGGTNILNLQPGHFRKNRSKILQSAIDKLLAIRKQRVRPSLDDKILTSWNGLMITSFAKAGRVLSEPKYTKAAEDAAHFILTQLKDKSGHLIHRWVSGEAKYDSLDEDYAFFIHGLIELYQADFDTGLLNEAAGLQKIQDKSFEDIAKGGYFFTAGTDKQLLHRGKKFIDNVTPSANSMTLLNLFNLSDLLVDRSLREKAEKLFKAFPKEALDFPQAFPQMLMALDYALDKSKEIAVISGTSETLTQKMIRAFNQDFNPNMVLASGPPGETDVPLLKGRSLSGGKPTAYVCINHVCKLPTNNLEQALKSANEHERFTIE